MTPQQQNNARDIEELLIDCKRRLNAAAVRGNIPEASRLGEQMASLSRLLVVAS